MTEDYALLSRIIRALMAYHGPVTIIRAVIVEADKVIEDMAKGGHIKEAKHYAGLLTVIATAVKEVESTQ